MPPSVKRLDHNRSLAQFDELLPNWRMRKIRDAVLERYPSLGDDMQIASYVQPRQMLEDKETGLSRPYPEQAVFLMTSPNPHKRHVGDTVKTNAFTALSNWRESERDSRHSTDVDLAERFFMEIAREHLAVMRNWRELI